MGQFSWYSLRVFSTYSSIPVNWKKLKFCFCKQILSIGVQYVYKRCAGVFLSLDELIWWFYGCFIVGYAWLFGCQVGYQLKMLTNTIWRASHSSSEPRSCPLVNIFARVIFFQPFPESTTGELYLSIFVELRYLGLQKCGILTNTI